MTLKIRIPRAFLPSSGRGFTALATAPAPAGATFHATLTGPQAAQAKRLGLALYAWTVNEPTESARLARYVDGIITDHPSRFLQQE